MSYKDLEVYNKGYKLAIKIHQVTMIFPRHELYEIGSQLRRAAVSIPLNVAEGHGRSIHVKDFRKFLINALGSCNEVLVLLEMIRDLGYIEKDDYQNLYQEYNHLGKQINKLVQTLKNTYRNA
ncbi:S23 ribosomal protein [Desulfotomaculum nigrificans CO-1-SRB]|uniref:S23 ribosomal protein n=1 Tax=Desulfotomaculum nigrificans (strain DSM 14880 / VKM B-2319 / CO-1-SRB) TaxID=868595 RepID=F6B5M5_DESCC|nr:four helix bundle protein [Desulfotomaculum nigrificans]AEF95457.1 S23 ribosomal protein [Desulfotomaculum nigrificans CO-1-SRB]